VADLALLNGFNESSSLYGHLRKTFLVKSERTFLWVSFMYEDLKEKSVGEIESSLELLPNGLDGVYESIIGQIKVTDRQAVGRILKWVTLAMTPLTVPALCEFAEIKATPNITAEETCVGFVISCDHFFKFSNEPTRSADLAITVQLLHQSARDLLVSSAAGAFRLDLEQASVEIASNLINCLPGLAQETHLDGTNSEDIDNPGWSDNPKWTYLEDWPAALRRAVRRIQWSAFSAERLVLPRRLRLRPSR
jgi:hypothetical protein